MKKTLGKILLLLTVPLMLIGCAGKKEAPITDKAESTIIKNAKNTDEYTKSADYKSLAYAFIYKIKKGLQSYESETNGTVTAKVLFINYNIKFNSVTFKQGDTFYSKDNSTSALMTVKNEYYMVDNEKILVSKDLKKYDTYTVEDFKKVSYTMAQYTVMGYVFNNESIIETELVSDKDDVVSVKYTLDNELSTNLIKVDMKQNGGLSSYPSFKKIEMTLSMKKDFTPVSYGIDAVYEASKAVVGTTQVTQHAECLFSKINEKITIPNEAFLAEKLGAKPSEVPNDDDEQPIKDELLDALKRLDFAKGVNVKGNLTLTLLDSPVNMTLDANVAFDLARISEDKIYDLLSLYAKAEGDETFNSLVGIINTFAGDKLGEYKSILDNFKSIEAVYDGDGGIFLLPTNRDGVQQTVLKIKLVDIADLILKRINVYNIVNGSNEDQLAFKKIEGKDKDNYQVEISINPGTIATIKEKIDALFANETYAMLKTLLSYQDFSGIKIVVGVENAKLKSLDASLDYLKVDATVPTSLVKVHLDAEEKTFDFATQVTKAKETYDAFSGVQALKTRLSELSHNVYVNRTYLSSLEKAYAEYEALTQQQKDFIGYNLSHEIESAIRNVKGVLNFIDFYKKYDLNNLSNEDILALSKAYKEFNVNSTMLSEEIGKEDYNKLTSLSSYVDFSIFDSAINKFNGDDENAWGLTVDEIKGIKLLFDIGDYDSSVGGQIYFKLLLAGKTITADDLKVKITNLYNKIQNS